VYKGYLQGSARVPMGNRQGGLNGIINGILNVKTVPLSGGTEMEVEYYGDRFQGVTSINSSVPGLSGSSRFSGVRSGRVCQWVAEDGHQGVSDCSFDSFNSNENYTNPNGQKISVQTIVTAMSVIDIGAQEAKRAADAAEAKQKSDSEAAEKAAREKKLDDALTRALRPQR
jgi:hypothetical protein